MGGSGLGNSRGSGLRDYSLQFGKTIYFEPNVQTKRLYDKKQAITLPFKNIYIGRKAYLPIFRNNEEKTGALRKLCSLGKQVMADCQATSKPGDARAPLQSGSSLN